MSSSSSSSSFPFSTIIITSPGDPSASPVESLLSREEFVYKLPTHVKLVSCSDPFGARCGSGGGTLAAIDYASSSCTCPDGGSSSSILIIHAGGESSRCPTQMVLGKAWTTLPLCDNHEHGTVVSNPTVLLIQILAKVFRHVPRGSIVVAASDCLLHLPLDDGADSSILDFETYCYCSSSNNNNNGGVLGVAVPAPVEVATNHGIYCINPKGKVTQFLQKPSIQTMHATPHCVLPLPNRNNSQAWIDTGVVAFLPQSAKALRSLASSIEQCTETGLRRLYSQQHQQQQQKQQQQEHESLSLEAFAQKHALRVELYTHILLALSTDSYDAYLDSVGKDSSLPVDVLQLLYTQLSQFSLGALALRQGQFRHLGTSRELVEFLNNRTDPLACQAGIVARVQCFLPCPTYDCVVVNTVVESPSVTIGKGSVLEHVHLICSKRVCIGAECLVSSVRGSCETLEIPNRMCFQMIPHQDTNALIYMYLGLDDGIKEKLTTIWGLSWNEICRCTDLQLSDLWDDDESSPTLWKARIHPILRNVGVGTCEHGNVFSWITAILQSQTPLSSDVAQTSFEAWKALPRLSLSEIQRHANAVREFQYRSHLETHVLAEVKTRHLRLLKTVLVLKQHTECNLETYIASFGATRCWAEVHNVVKLLEDVVLEAFTESQYDVSGRASMLLSNLYFKLALVADSPSLKEAEYDLLDEFKTLKLPDSMSTPDSLDDMFQFFASVLHMDGTPTAVALSSCAVVMEKFAAIMTERCCKRPLSLEKRVQPAAAPVDAWVVAMAPARIDLSGGWSDTPPICVEYGGAVCGIAVTVDGRLPLEAKCRMISDSSSSIVVRSEGRDNKTEQVTNETTVTLTKVGDLKGYCNPKSDCSLIKCALVYCGLASVETITERPNEDLSSFLTRFCGVPNVGLEIITTSRLPHGSGMGTSSILGGCVLAAIMKCVGIETKDDELIHMVLMLEQLLSTGGGWQDQVGGLIGGAKLGTSRPVLPLSTNVERIALSPEFQEQLDQRLLLAFSGQTRLAKNLLQNVLRRWAQRSPDVVETVQQLTAGANKARDCLLNQDMEGLASCLNDYWNQKKIMAGGGTSNDDSGVEPAVVKLVFDELKSRDLIVAGSLCGAGGGGFMVVMLQRGCTCAQVQQTCSKLLLLHNDTVAVEADFTWHECKLSEQGLVITIVENAT